MFSLVALAAGCERECQDLCEAEQQDEACSTPYRGDCAEICDALETLAADADCESELDSYNDCVGNYKDHICEPSYQSCQTFRNRLFSCYDDFCITDGELPAACKRVLDASDG